MHDVRVDAYVEGARPFAQPVLHKLRELMHQACPEVEETMKWGQPFFVSRGVILANMSAFKEHCAFGLWGPAIQAVMAKDGMRADGAMGSFGRITGLGDLPSDEQLLDYMRQAAGFVARGERTRSLEGRKAGATKGRPEVPAELAAALAKKTKAAAAFERFSPSAQREYTSWIAEAKRPETKERRVAQALEWIGEGKQRNWKNQPA